MRDPRWHIASLMKQHRLFCAEERRDPRILKHMQRAGHLEFGLDRRAINVGDAATPPMIASALARGPGGARLGALLGDALWLRRSASASATRGPGQASLIVRYEDLCDQAEATLAAGVRPCRLELAAARTRRRWRRGSASRATTNSAFTAEEEAIIADETGARRRRAGLRLTRIG